MKLLRPFPVLTAVTLGLSAVGTATRLFGTGVMHALWRDPSALGDGQVWRLLTPVLVQSDTPLLNVLGVFALCAAVGALAERYLPRRVWLAAYLAGALAGHALGEAFQPHQSGTSVAFMGVLGALAALAASGRAPELYRWRFHVAGAVVLALVDTALGDIHGVAFLAGVGVGALWLTRAAAASARRRAGFSEPPLPSLVRAP